ncbi:hypothetical protein OG607_07355 [Streptomyces sp. NBC_01537]|uniref:hypothetical protein n=1 Tax=Streptomyces sp. NBC_01537 TaxID=2903896 RepID=UPI00386DB2B1
MEHTASEAREPEIPAHRAHLRVLAVAFAVATNAAAALLMTTRGLPEAVAGAALAGVGWVVTGRLAAWHPASAS